MKSFTVTRDTDLKRFTDETYPQGSFAFSALLRSRDIRVNGKRTGENVPLRHGDTVAYYTTERQEGVPSHLTVFSDENVYVADKYTGVSCEGLESELRGGGDFRLVHRIDRNTAGLLLFARNGPAEEELLRAFRERDVEKTYICVCRDSFAERSGTLTAYLRKDAERSLVEVYDEPREGAKRIVTGYEVAEERDGLALVRVFPGTGRTHQIRAHLAHVSCPVLGDGKYGDAELNKEHGARRQRLVAKELTLRTRGCLAYLSGRTFESSFSFDEFPEA